MKHLTNPSISKRNDEVLGLPAWERIIRGTLMRYRRTCGNRGCRCYRGVQYRHGPYWYLAVQWAGKRQKLYALKAASVPKVRQGIAAYKKLWKTAYKIAELNLEILLSEGRHKEP